MNISKMLQKQIFYLAIIATVLAIIVIGVGAYTRLVHAGLGCPDWPGCYGLLKPPSTAGELSLARQNFPGMDISSEKGWVEMFHRYIAGVLLLLIAYITVRSWINKHNNNNILASAILIFTLLQAAFGMWTVTLKLWPQVVVSHLLGGMVISSLLFNLALREYYNNLSIIDFTTDTALQLKLLKNIATLALFIVFLQIAIGGWTSANYASLACTDFPTCKGKFFPQIDFISGFNLFLPIGENYLGGKLDSAARTAIHLTHRYCALIVLIIISTLIYQSKKIIYKLGNFKKSFISLLYIIFVIMLMQITLGIINVIFHLPLIVAVAHTLIASLLLLSLVAYNFYIRCLVKK